MKFRLILFFLIFSCFSRAQSPAAYYKKLTEAKSDTARINAYNALTEYYLSLKNDSAVYFNEKSLELSGGENNENYNHKAYYLKAELNRSHKNYPEALKAAEKARQLAKLNERLNDEADALVLSGMIFQDARQGKLAVANFTSALKLSVAGKYKKGIISSNIHLGLYFKENNESTNALDYFLRAYPLTEKSTDTDAFFRCCINLGSLYERTKDQKKALLFYRKALSIAPNDEAGQAICYFKMGRLFAGMGLNDSSDYYLNRTMKLHLKRNDEVGLILDYCSLASIALKRNDYREAEKNYDISLQLAFKYNDSMRIASVYGYKGNMYREHNEYKKALDCYRNSLRFTSSNMAGESLMVIYRDISEIYKKEGMYKEAYENFVLFKSWSDSTHNIAETKKQTELKLGFEFNKIQEKLKADADAKEAINKAERDKDREQRNYLLAGLALISLLLVIALRSYRAKQKANQILAQQKMEIESQKKLVDQKNREISDSINYAHRIQTSCLPEKKELEAYFPQYALFFRPKDVVSGDFFWAAQTGDKVLIAVADCTGHGVPGAITSMIGSMLLNEIFYVKNIHMPDKVLSELNRLVKLTLRQEEESLTRDGMDIAFCMWDKTGNRLYYSGANRSIYLLRPGEGVSEYKATKQSVGGYTPLIQQYELHSIQLQKGDTIVLTSDGYADQFGGNKEKKFTTKAFRNMLDELTTLAPTEQKAILEKRFDLWKGNFDQTDDVLVFAFKV